MTQISRTRERGVALIALLAVIALGASWFLVSRLNDESVMVTAVTRNRNAEVLNRAKLALIGYVAQQAAKTGENDPGALPCPEAAGYFGDLTQEGTAAPNCSLPKVGRFPWRTVGSDKLVDTAGEPLWYVVANGWAKPNSTTNTAINSDCASSTSVMTCWSGQLRVDGVDNSAVALIIAPGPAINVAAATGCAAISQTRGTSDWRNYLECDNATNPADASFVTTGPSGSFNDQVMKITAAEILPAIEAAIAYRIEREIVPLLKDVYIAPNWGLAGSDRLYPFAAPFAKADISSFTGTAGTMQGLLPFAYAETFPSSGIACTAGASAPRCNPTLVSWSDPAPTISYPPGAGVTLSSSCSYWGPTDYAYCNGTYTGAPTQITVSGTQSNGAMSLRQIRAATTGFVFWQDMTTFSFTWSQPSPTLQLKNVGTLTVAIAASPPASAGPAGVMYWIYVPGNATADHPLLDSRASSATTLPAVAATAWFARNDWHKLLYYAIAPGYAASAAPPRACSDAGVVTCLQLLNFTDPNKQRVVLILAGRSLPGQASHPTANLQDYLDSTENRNGDSVFEQLKVGRTFNDRFVSVAKNP